MHIKFKTDQLLDDENERAECPFTGTVTVDMPSHEFRSKFAMEVGLLDLASMAGTPGQEPTMEEKLKKALRASEIQGKASEMVLKKIVECDLKHSDGETPDLKTAEDLWCHPDAEAIVEALIFKFGTNFRSKKTKPSLKDS